MMTKRDEPVPDGEDVTALLQAWRNGDPAAADRLMEVVYHELRRTAASYLRRERPDHTLQPTALVNEAYVRLQGKEDLDLKDRVHFFAVAAQEMRRILVDHARARSRAKRGGGAVTVALDEEMMGKEDSILDVLIFDEALTKLGALDPRQETIVELRFIAGRSAAETAEYLGVSVPTVVNDTRSARAFLHRELRSGWSSKPS